jgi:thiamine-phosphate pyrophosphorylase
VSGAPRIEGLYFLADDDPRWRRDPVSQARAALAGGARAVQLRAKRATDSQAVAWAEAIRELCRAHGALFFVNDRFELALAAGADGVHLGQDDLPPARIPAAARARLRVGRSTHTLEQARAAAGEAVDYVAFGPVFATRSKDSPYAARGLRALSEAAVLVAPLPLVAIGGIDAARAGDALRAGAAAVCAISAVAGADDMETAARAMARAIDAARRAGAEGPPA